MRYLPQAFRDTSGNREASLAEPLGICSVCCTADVGRREGDSCVPDAELYCLPVSYLPGVARCNRLKCPRLDCPPACKLPRKVIITPNRFIPWPL